MEIIYKTKNQEKKDVQSKAPLTNMALGYAAENRMFIQAQNPKKYVSWNTSY